MNQSQLLSVVHFMRKTCIFYFSQKSKREEAERLHKLEEKRLSKAQAERLHKVKKEGFS